MPLLFGILGMMYIDVLYHDFPSLFTTGAKTIFCILFFFSLSLTLDLFRCTHPQLCALLLSVNQSSSVQ